MRDERISTAIVIIITSLKSALAVGRERGAERVMGETGGESAVAPGIGPVTDRETDPETGIEAIDEWRICGSGGDKVALAQINGYGS